MKKSRLFLVLVLVFTLFTAGCGTEGVEFSLNKPFKIVAEKGEYSITVTGAIETDWMPFFSKEKAKESMVVALVFDVENISYDDQIGIVVDEKTFRVFDENGSEVPAWDYHFDDDHFPGAVKVGETQKECWYGYVVSKNTRYIEVDIYNNTKDSNKIKIDIKK